MLIQANNDTSIDRALDIISESSKKRSQRHDDLVTRLADSNKRQDKADAEEHKVILKIMETKQENMRVMTPAAKGVFDSWECSCAFSPSSQSLGGADTLHDEALPI